MSTFKEALFADLGHTGGLFFLDAVDFAGGFLSGTISTNTVLTRNAVGDYSWNRTAGGAETYIFVAPLTDIKRLLETAPLASGPFQEQFGTGASTPGWPAAAPGIPPFAGVPFSTPPTGPPPKGLQITDVFAVYQITTQALTAASFSLNKTTFVNNVANVITNIPVNATAVPLGTQANPFVVVRAVNSPAFDVTDTAGITLEASFTLQNGSVFRFYGAGFHLTFNYN